MTKSADDSYLEAASRSAQLERDIAEHPERFRVLTGDRPTGPLHLGHYFGTLTNRVRLQGLGLKMFVVIADYQVITDRDGVGDLTHNVHEILLDYLATGIDPRTATIFTHSAVPALNQLMLPFLSLVSVAELQRNPTVKAEAAAAGGRALSGLLLTYPVHQAADILFCRGNVVPVGKDQLPHLETTRLVARRFNERYGTPTAVFAEPRALLSSTPLLLGLDGTKMSKSRGNAVMLGDTEDVTAQRIRAARTDNERRITYEPHRRPEVANLLHIAGLCAGRSPQDIADEIGHRGAGTLKSVTTEAVNEHFGPLRRRRRALAGDRHQLRQVLLDGNARASEVADDTLRQVRAVMQMSY